MIRITENVFDGIYQEAKFNEAYKTQHFTELLVSKVVEKIELDTKGCEEEGPFNWPNLDSLRNLYAKQHSETENKGNCIYRQEFYGRKSSSDDAIIPPIQFLAQIVEKLYKDKIGAQAIKVACSKWFGKEGLDELSDLTIVDRLIDELKTHGTTKGNWDEVFQTSINPEKLVAPKDDKPNMCYFDKGFNKEKNCPIR